MKLFCGKSNEKFLARKRTDRIYDKQWYWWYSTLAQCIEKSSLDFFFFYFGYGWCYRQLFEQGSILYFIYKLLNLNAAEDNTRIVEKICFCKICIFSVKNMVFSRKEHFVVDFHGDSQLLRVDHWWLSVWCHLSPHFITVLRISYK